MSELLKAFDSYNDLVRKSYFTLCFDELASELLLETPLVASKENMNKVLDLMKLKSNDFEIVLKNWDTEDTSNADFSRDFPNEYLFKSNSKKGIIWVALSYDTLYIEFLYDCKDADLEKWVIETNHLVRKEFGLSRAPIFKVLVMKSSEFKTEDVRTEKTVIDIENNYNEDFEPVHNKIEESLKSNESGLILLYGESGTGKTTYIKNLISNHGELNFIFVQNEFVTNLLEPAFISFLLKQRNSILVIEDAEKVITSRSQLKQDSVVSTVLQLTDGLFSDYLNIKVICTFNSSLSKIDTALLRKGRLIVMYEFKPLNIEKTNKLLSTIGGKNSDKELTVSDIYNFKEKGYDNVKQNKVGFK